MKSHVPLVGCSSTLHKVLSQTSRRPMVIFPLGASVFLASFQHGDYRIRLPGKTHQHTIDAGNIDFRDFNFQFFGMSVVNSIYTSIFINKLVVQKTTYSIFNLAYIFDS